MISDGKIGLSSIVFFSFLICAAFSYGRDLTCATWNMDWFPSGKANFRIPEIEPARIDIAGAILSEATPDILFAQEIRDSETCARLARVSGTNALAVAVCSAFADATGIPMFQQCAILTRLPVIEFSWDRWQTFGTVDPPRGFAYALLNFEGELIACYCVHLKSNLARSTTGIQLNILKRELAIRQLLTVIRNNLDRKGRNISKILVAGDLNTNLDDPLFISESTLRDLAAEGFRDGFEGLPQEQRVTHPANGPYPDSTFDYIFHKGFYSCGSLQITPSCNISDHRMVSLRFK